MNIENNGKKPRTNLDYAKRIKKSIEYIRQNLQRKTLISEVAKEAGFSTFHFHRIFKDIMNEPVGEYITRKKLESAAISLAYGQEVKVTDLAEKYDYSSVSSFSKSFANWFGCRPQDVKDLHASSSPQFGKLKARYDKDLILTELLAAKTAKGDHKSQYEIVDEKVDVRNIEQVSLYYLPSNGGYKPEALHEVWSELCEKSEDHGLDWESLDRFAICHDHPGLVPVEQCQYDACIKIEQGWKSTLPFLETKIPSGRYAVFSCSGPMDTIFEQYLEFYTHWLPFSGYEAADFPVIDHYLTNCIETGADMVVELWAKINRL